MKLPDFTNTNVPALTPAVQDHLPEIPHQNTPQCFVVVNWQIRVRCLSPGILKDQPKLPFLLEFVAWKKTNRVCLSGAF